MNKVQAIEHTTVEGRKEYYLKAVHVTTGTVNYLTVGKKTWAGVKAMGTAMITDENIEAGREAGMANQELPFGEVDGLAPLEGGEIVNDQKETNATNLENKEPTGGQGNR